MFNVESKLFCVKPVIAAFTIAPAAEKALIVITVPTLAKAAFLTLAILIILILPTFSTLQTLARLGVGLFFSTFTFAKMSHKHFALSMFVISGQQITFTFPSVLSLRDILAGPNIVVFFRKLFIPLQSFAHLLAKALLPFTTILNSVFKR